MGSIDGSSNHKSWFIRGKVKADIKKRTELQEFVYQFECIGRMMQSAQMRELFVGLTSALKRLFKASKVTYLIQDKKLKQQLMKEGQRMRQIYHLHTKFWFQVPDGVAENDY